MLETRVCGVFDSGLGGLTAVKELLHLGCDIIYFGDTGRLPYGTRSDQTILKYAEQGIAFLKSQLVDTIVIACGTVSAVALPKLDFDIPLIGVIKPACKKAIELTKTGKIGIIATNAAIRSGAYENELLNTSKGGIKTFAKAASLLIPTVEAGRTDPKDPLVKLLLEEYLEPIIKENADTIILGCTHYPLLTEAIRLMAGDSVSLVNPGACAADEIFSSADKPGCIRYYVSDGIEDFAKNASLFLGKPVLDNAELIDLDILENLHMR